MIGIAERNAHTSFINFDVNFHSIILRCYVPMSSSMRSTTFLRMKVSLNGTQSFWLGVKNALFVSFIPSPNNKSIVLIYLF